MTKRTHRAPRSQHLLAAGFLGFSILMGLMGGIRSSANRSHEDEPASEGRRITPAGSLVIDATTRQPAVGALPVNFVRSPDHRGPDGLGRYLIAVNSGFGIQFNAAGNRGQQSLGVMDLNAKPVPAIIQNVYFPSPQSVNVGVVFSPVPDDDGSYALYASGGFENKIWIFHFRPDSQNPISPTSAGPNTVVNAPFIDVTGFATTAPSPRYNDNHAPVYPTGLAISPDGNTLFVVNNLSDNLGIIHDLRGARKLERIQLWGRNGKGAQGQEHFTYPYTVVAIPYGPPSGRDRDAAQITLAGSPQATVVPPSPGYTNFRSTAKAYVSCWNDGSIAVVDFAKNQEKISYIPVGRHPTAMLWDGTRSRLYAVNSDDDSVSMIDTRYDREVERISVRLAEHDLPGNSPEGLALDSAGTTLYVANAHSNSVAVITLSPLSLDNSGSYDRPVYLTRPKNDVSRVRGFIPTGQYPSALAVVGDTIFVGNGKGTGVENSSVVVNNSGRAPNAPNDHFPVGTGRGSRQGGEYSVALVAGNLSAVPRPDDPALVRYTQQVMRNNLLLGPPQTQLFPGPSPIKHVIYIIKENRTYDQVFGDIEHSGDGDRADGDPRLAIFGAGEAAARTGGAAQNITPNHHALAHRLEAALVPPSRAQDITPNHHALALRFGLFDRFFVNAEASPDGHNWSTAAFSNDYVDKAYRWNYGRRGRGYDFEGFNRLPEYNPVRGSPALFGPSVETEDVANFMKRFIPYLQGSRDVAEPETLYLWDAAARAGVTYRNYGEFVATLSQADVAAIKTNRAKSYPDISPTVSAFPTKKSLENHYSSSFRNFDLDTPDAMDVESYRAAKDAAGAISPLIDNAQPEARFRGASRLGAWLEEFRGFVSERNAGKPDGMPNLSIVRLPNDHTDGIKARRPTPQFFVADNDYALGKLVEAVSNSPYWKDTAIFVVEDDAQDGPDHVDAHRSVALVISAYNRPGLLVHEFHNTVSLIRTMELLLGIAPMNQLDANAAPMNLFRAEADLRPYQAQLPNVAIDNLVTPPARDATTAYWMNRTGEQDLSHPDMADPAVLNQIIWFSVRGRTPMPLSTRLPAFDAMRVGLTEAEEELAREEKSDDRDASEPAKIRRRHR
jgi:DNA-binding beta-propeller fold protein YncE